MCTVDIQYATAENRRGKKKKEKRRKKKKKKNHRTYSTGRHKNWKSKSKCKNVVYMHDKCNTVPVFLPFYSAPQCSHCKRCTSSSVCLSVCPSDTRRYCVKTTARSTVQIALSDSKMCLSFVETKKYSPETTPSPEILGQTDLPPNSSES